MRVKRLNCVGGERSWEVWDGSTLLGYVTRRPTDRLYRVFEYTVNGPQFLGVGLRVKTTAALLDRKV